MTADSTTAGSAGQILTAATVLTPDAVLSPGWVRVEGDRVTEVGDGLPHGSSGSAGRDEWVATDLGAVTLAPGFVDVHSHGGGGAAYTDGVEAAGIARAAHLAHGTTSTMASLVTDTVDRLVDQVRALAPLVARDELLGVHLEGPWLAERYKGAHDPELLRAPSPEDVDRLIAAGPVAMVTLAPELPGAAEAVRRFVEAGVLVAVGHSDATYDQALGAFAAGARVVTHLHNAHRPLHHREPGPAQAAIDTPGVVLELIADGVHVHPAVVGDTLRTRAGRVALVTDAMAAAGAGDGDYRLGPLTAVVRDGVARIGGADGPIAGSTLTLDRAVRLAVARGIPLAEAVAAASRVPADLLGRADLGRIAPGARADLVVLDADLAVARVMRAGHWA